MYNNEYIYIYIYIYIWLFVSDISEGRLTLSHEFKGKASSTNAYVISKWTSSKRQGLYKGSASGRDWPILGQILWGV